MLFLRKHLLQIGLLLILLASGVLCGYSLGNYDANTMQGETRIEQRNSVPNTEIRPSSTPNQTPKGQLPDQNIRQRAAAPQGAPATARPGSTGSNSSTVIAPYLLAYAVMFFALCIVAYGFFMYRQTKINRRQTKTIIVTLLCSGLLLRFYAATLMTGHSFDINTFRSWATAAANNLLHVYSSGRTSDYPPLYMYILCLVGKLGNIPALTAYYPLLLKLPSIIADIATAFLIYKLAQKYLSAEMGIWLAAFYIFNPAIFINSTFWGQVDSFFSLIVVGAVWALAEMRISLAAILFTGAVMMKPQGIIFLPVLFFELLRQKSLKNFIKTAVCALGTALIMVLPFSLNNNVLWIVNLFAKTVGEYPYASVNAFNLFSLLGANYRSDAAIFLVLSYHTWGMIFIVLVTAYSWFIYTKGNRAEFIPAVALFQIAGVFTLATSMHERYLFPAVGLAILAFIYLRDKRLLLLAMGFSCTVFINTYVVLFATLQGTKQIAYNPTLIITSLLNVLLLFYLGKVLFDRANNHITKASPAIDAAAQ